MNLTTFESTFPADDFCQLIDINYYPAFNYRKDPSDRLSCEVFNENPPNEYSVITEYTIIIVGQLVTSGMMLFVGFFSRIGIELSWNRSVTLDATAEPLYLCIPLEDYIEHDDFFNTYELGLINYESGSDAATISRVLPGGIPAIVTGGYLCGNVTKPAIYIGIKVVLNADSRYRSLLGQGIVGSVFYWLLLACLFSNLLRKLIL